MLYARELLSELTRQIENACSDADPHSQNARDELIDALLRAGELECALEDRSLMFEQRIIAEVSDELARALIAEQFPAIPESVLQSLGAIEISDRLSVSRPEGFCYYALHPLDYVDALKEAQIRSPAVAVIGIRSIGTTLSAVVRAWFQQQGVSAERITVRPTGHPFDRKLVLDGAQYQWIGKNAQRGAMFLIVDEGPGLSGSSFLAVAEALVNAGIPAGRIVLLPSSKPNFSSLIAENAAARWSKFRTLPHGPTRHVPSSATQPIGAGAWRKQIFASESEWPGVWDWTERQKYFSSDGQRVFRFDGNGHYGKAVRHRSEILAHHEWGPPTFNAGEGFTVFPWTPGLAAQKTIDRNVLDQLAQYCAFRAEYFSCEQDSQAALEEMAHMNLERAIGASPPIVLPLERAVIADARMMPNEWIRTSTGRMLKIDASSHGDDHFYPGPTDIAWDVAGAITEWELDRDGSDQLVAEYQRLSHDEIGSRLPAYLVAYCAFRLGFTLSAAKSVIDDQERGRFQREAHRYRRRLSTLLRLSTAA